MFSTSSALRLATLIFTGDRMTALGATVHVDENRYALLETSPSQCGHLIFVCPSSNAPDATLPSSVAANGGCSTGYCWA